MNPQYINYDDEQWFAEVECKVTRKNQAHIISLILKVEREKDMYKWSLIGARGDLFNNTGKPVHETEEILKKRSNDSTRYFLHPVSHAIGFMNIDQVFTGDVKKFDQYLYAGRLGKELLDLREMIDKNELKFIGVRTISYHLLQIPGFILIVDYFNRLNNNSGWLLNVLMEGNVEQKKIYLNKHLNVSGE